MSLKDEEAAVIVNEIIEQKFKGHAYNKQDIDKIISDLQAKVDSDFLTLTYDLVGTIPPPPQE